MHLLKNCCQYFSILFYAIFATGAAVFTCCISLRSTSWERNLIPSFWVAKSKTDGRTKSMSFREVYCIYMYWSRCFKCCCCVVISFQRGGAYAVLIGGWSLGAYLIQWTWSNLKDLLLNHNQWVIGYLVVIGMSLKRPIDMRTRFNHKFFRVYSLNVHRQPGKLHCPFLFFSTETLVRLFLSKEVKPSPDRKVIHFRTF